MNVHHCPHCRCLPDLGYAMGYVNRDAPFYPLVALIDSLDDVDPRCRTGVTGGKWRRKQEAA